MIGCTNRPKATVFTKASTAIGVAKARIPTTSEKTRITHKSLRSTRIKPTNRQSVERAIACQPRQVSRGPTLTGQGGLTDHPGAATALDDSNPNSRRRTRCETQRSPSWESSSPAASFPTADFGDQPPAGHRPPYPGHRDRPRPVRPGRQRSRLPARLQSMQRTRRFKLSPTSTNRRDQLAAVSPGIDRSASPSARSASDPIKGQLGGFGRRPPERPTRLELACRWIEVSTDGSFHRAWFLVAGSARRPHPGRDALDRQTCQVPPLLQQFRTRRCRRRNAIGE